MSQTIPGPGAPAALADSRQPCLYCGDTDLVPLYRNVTDRLGYVPGTREFWRCQKCGSAMLVPQPKASDLAAFYPPVYSFTLELGNQSWFKKMLSKLEYHLFFRPQYVAQVKQVLRGCRWQGQSGLRLLDVGCGRGLRLLEFRRRGFDVCGMDVQQDVVDYLQNKLEIPAICAEVEELPRSYPHDSFDIITAFFVLEHVTDVGAVLSSCWKLLRPGGWFVGAVPFVDSLQAGFFGSRWINVREAPRHLSLPTQAGMKKLCQQIGYDQVSIQPDSVLNCAGQIGSSLLPGATLTHVYGGGRVLALLARLVGAGVTLLSIPFCLAENYIWRRVSLGLVFAHKPETEAPGR